MTTYQVKLVEKSSQNVQIVEVVQGKNVVNVVKTPNKHNIAVVEKTTGKSPKTLQMKRKGKDLFVELEDETVIKFVDYYSSEEVAFIGELDTGLTIYDVPTVETVSKAQPITTSASTTSIGKVVAGVGLALGGIAGLASAGGGGKSGDSNDSKPNTNTNNTPQNNKPTAIQLSKNSVNENAQEAIIGKLTTTDADKNDTHTYSVNDDRFEVVNGELKLKKGISLDYETVKSIPIEVTSTDKGGLSTKQTFTITVNDIVENTKPTAIQLSKNSVNENAVGATIGTLTTTDTDPNDTHTYTVSDSRFEVVNGELKLKNGVSLDYETVKSIPIEVTSTDKGGLSTKQTFTITVNDVNETPVTPPPAPNAKVESINANSSVNEGQTLTATVTLDNTNGNPNLAFKLAGLETNDYTKLTFGNGVTRNNDGTLNIPKNIKTFTVSLDIVADNTTEGQQSLTLTVGDKPTIVKVVDSSVTPPPPTNAKVASIKADSSVNEGQTLTATVTLDNVNGNPNLAFKLDGLETADYNNLVFSNGVTRNSNGTLNIPKNVKTFTISLNIIADNTTEGEQSLTLTVGDKPAVVKVIDTSTTPVVTPPPADAKVVSVTASEKVNEGQTLTATVTLDNVNGNPNLAFKLDGLETADYNNLVFSNGVTRNSNGTLNIPKNVKTFTVALNIIADNTTEGEQSLTLTVGNKPAVVKVIDTSTTPVQNQAPTDIRLDKNVVKENAQGVVIGNLTTDDIDQNDTFTYTITDSNSPFEIINGNQLKLKAGQSFNFENTKNIVVNIKTTDAGGLSTNKAFTINVENVNEQPTEITLAGTKSVDENAVGATIGTLTTTDPDAGDTFTYSVNDQRFEVVNGQLKLKAGQSLNYEDSPTVRLEITSTDAGGKFITRLFDIQVNNVNEAPTDIRLDKNVVKENAQGVVIGNLTTDDLDQNDTFTYTITDSNSPFEIVGNQLKLKAGQPFDFEMTKSAVVNIQTTDAGGSSFNKAFTINVENVNEQPTEITLAGTKSVDENAVGATIGTLTTTDPDAGDTFTYSVNDQRFEVVNGQLKLKAGQSLNYEDSSTVRLEITSTDAGGKFITRPFDIQVNNVNEAPTSISLSTTSVEENARGAVVGTLSTKDPDTADTHTYTVSGDDRFEIVGNQLKLKQGAFLDYEKEKNINLTITSSDGQLSKPQSFTITITDVNDDGYIWGIDNLTYAKALNGTDNDDTLVGLKGKDYLRGGKGNDTYIFSKGDGLDEIEDWSDIAGEFNTIKFTDVNISDIQKISTTADGYLGLNIHYGDGDVIKLEEYSKQHTLSKVIFADGTTMSVADLMKKVPSHIEAVATNSIVADTVANDVITDSKGNHSYWGHSTVSGGNDTYVFKTGGGKDIIYEKDKQNKIVFTDVSSENITLSHHKDYVTIHYGNGDEVKFNPNAMSEIQFQDTTWNVSNLKEHLNLPYWTESLLFGYTQNSTYMDKNDDKVMYFAFPNTNLRTDHQDGWAAFTEAQKEVARKAFKNLEQFLPIKFIEKKEAPTQIEDDVIYLQNAKLAAGVAGLGGWNNKGGGDVWMGSSVVNDDTLHVIAHEIGHAIGLNHPQRYPNDPPIGEEGGQKRHSLNDAEDKGIWTIMSYDNKTRSSDYQEFDIAVLQYLYGVNPDVRTGDDQYFFSSTTGQFVWDGAGKDTINASSATENVYINLNAGTHSYMGQKSDLITAGNQLTINHGTVIENATGGKGNDTLIGNTANNVLTGGAGNDTLTGGKGLDVFNFSPLTNDATGGNGHDTITDFQLGNIHQNTQADMLNLVGLLVGHNGDKSVTGLEKYLSTTQQNGNTVLSIDRDGSGSVFAQADLVTLEKVQTTLADLLANQQIII